MTSIILSKYTVFQCIEFLRTNWPNSYWPVLPNFVKDTGATGVVIRLLYQYVRLDEERIKKYVK